MRFEQKVDEQFNKKTFDANFTPPLTQQFIPQRQYWDFCLQVTQNNSLSQSGEKKQSTGTKGGAIRF